MMSAMRSALSGTLRKDGRWQITLSLTAPDGTSVKKTVYGKTQGDVQAKAHKLIYDGKRVAPVKKNTVAALYGLFKTKRFHGLAPKSQEYYEWTSMRILERFGDMEVAKITPPMVAQWLESLSLSALSGRTVQMHRNCLRVLLSFAREQGWVRDNAADGVRLPMSAKPKDKPQVTPAMARLIRMKERNQVLKDLWWTLSECGMRPAEALKLTREDLYEERQMWWLRIAGTKTEAAERVVPVPLSLAERLKRHSGYLFPTGNLTPWSLRNVQREWYKAVERAGLPRTNLYQLRKCCLTRWIERGMPDDAVKYFAGHTDIRLTQNRYKRTTIGRLTSALIMSGLSNQYVDPLGSVRKVQVSGSKDGAG